MNYYLLSLMSDLGSENFCKQIAGSLNSVVDGPRLKFYYSGDFMVFSFASKTGKKELYKYFKKNLFDNINVFILTKVEDDYSFHFSQYIEKDLLIVRNEGDDLEMAMDMVRIQNNLKSNDDEFNLRYEDLNEDDFYLYDEDEGNDEFIHNLREKLMNDIMMGYPTPTLNEILDKISVGGVESLNEVEKVELYNYSQK